MPQGGKSAGHPVNVATGEMFAEYADIRIPGKYPLVFGRRYSTRWQPAGHSPLGPGWTLPFYAHLTKVGTEYRFRSPDGSLIVFSDPKDEVSHGGSILDPGTFSEVGKQGYFLKVARWNPDSGEIVHFLFKAGRNGEPWPLLFQEAPDGQGVEFAWDDRGLLKAVRQKLEKRRLDFSYTTDGRLSQIAFPHPEGQRILARFEYDAKGRLSAAYDALGAADRYEYDAAGRIVRETARDGGVFSFRYDDRERCIRTWGLGNYDLKVLRYLDTAGMTEVTDSHGAVTRYQWNGAGQVLLEIRPSGGRYETGYDAHGRIVGKKDPLGGEKKFGFDDKGNRDTIVDALGRETKDVFNGFHQPVKHVTPAGNVFAREYDASRRLAKTVDPMGAEWRFHYDADGNTVKVEMGSRTAQWSYGPNGTLLAYRDPEGHVTRYRMDAFGRVAEKTGPLGEGFRYRYDAMGRKLEEIRPDGRRIANVRDAAGNIVEILSADGARTRNEYGPCRRLLSITDPLGRATRMAWDTEPGRLLSIRNPKGETYSFAYDADGRRIRSRDFAGAEKTLKYDAVGNVALATNAMGETLAYKRDAAFRLLGIEASDGTALAFEYDDSDYLLSAFGPDGSIRYERDRLGRALAEETDGFKLAYAYTPDGRPAATASSLGLELGYGFDGRDLLRGISVGGAPFLEFTRNAAGAEIGRALPGSLRMEQVVDPSGRLLSQQVLPAASGAAPIVSRAYAWNGQAVTGIRDREWGDSAFVYDALEQLIQAARTGVPTADYLYDAAGNAAEERRGADVSDCEYGPGSRLLRKGRIRFEYDRQGRLIRKLLPPDFPGGPAATWEYAWDPFDQLRAVTAPDGSRWEYGYDPLGRRIRKQGPEGTTRYRWDRDVPLHEEKADGSRTDWIFDVHTYKPLGARAKGGLFPVICDHLGTPREILDDGGKRVWSAVFGPWGDVEEEKADGMACPIRFQGQWHDPETGLHYNRWRYYDPAMGRYITPDPVGLRGGLNPYRYCPNPINWIDPLGLDWNYVLVDADDKPYYSGVSTQDPSQVEKRHAENIGNDGQPRFDPDNGDRLIPITPINKGSANHETARGLEQRVAEDIGSVIGRQGSEGNNEDGGSVRGNNQNPVSPDSPKAEKRAEKAEKFLTDQDKTVQDLIDEGIERKNQQEAEAEKGCGG